MLFDILIQIAVMQQNADATRLLVEVREVLCGLLPIWATCQVFWVG